MPTDEAVERAVKRTAGTVTSAAVVMVAVFAVFATLRSLDIKQMGVGLAVAVLLDATIVRAVLLPAGMKLLGDWNWYLPRWLEWLPSLSARQSAGRPGCVQRIELDLAGLDGAAVDEQAARAVEPPADAFEPVDRDAAATEEVARADAVEDGVEPARRPGVVVALEPGEQVGEKRRPVALDAVDRAQRGRRDTRVRGQLLARLVDVQADPENDDPVPRLGEDRPPPCGGRP